MKQRLGAREWDLHVSFLLKKKKKICLLYKQKLIKLTALVSL